MAEVAHLERKALPVQRIRLPVEGMTCASCVGRVERAIRAVPGVAGANVNLATERAVVTFSGAPDPQAVVGAIAKTGYTVGATTTELSIAGMTCASCVGRVEKALKGVPGVLDSAVNLATERARMRHLVGAVSVADLEAAIGRATRPSAWTRRAHRSTARRSGVSARCARCARRC